MKSKRGEKIKHITSLIQLHWNRCEPAERILVTFGKSPGAYTCTIHQSGRKFLQYVHATMIVVPKDWLETAWQFQQEQNFNYYTDLFLSCQSSPLILKVKDAPASKWAKYGDNGKLLTVAYVTTSGLWSIPAICTVFALVFGGKYHYSRTGFGDAAKTAHKAVAAGLGVPNV